VKSYLDFTEDRIECDSGDKYTVDYDLWIGIDFGKIIHQNKSCDAVYGGLEDRNSGLGYCLELCDEAEELSEKLVNGAIVAANLPQVEAISETFAEWAYDNFGMPKWVVYFAVFIILLAIFAGRGKLPKMY
jgi:thiol-disulfide isomerase/thioredoxin